MKTEYHQGSYKKKSIPIQPRQEVHLQCSICYHYCYPVKCLGIYDFFVIGYSEGPKAIILFWGQNALPQKS